RRRAAGSPPGWRSPSADLAWRRDDVLDEEAKDVEGRDDTDQAPLACHEHVVDLAFAHERHHVLRGLELVDHGRLARHDVAGRAVSIRALEEGGHQVLLTEEAEDLVVAVDDRSRAESPGEGGPAGGIA